MSTDLFIKDPHSYNQARDRNPNPQVLMKNTCHHPNYQYENAVLLNQDGFFLK